MFVYVRYHDHPLFVRMGWFRASGDGGCNVPRAVLDDQEPDRFRAVSCPIFEDGHPAHAMSLVNGLVTGWRPLRLPSQYRAQDLQPRSPEM